MQRTIRNGLTRRRFLEGLGLTAAALPLVPYLESEADEGALPRRIIVFCTTTGMTGRYPGNWAPTGTEHDFALGKILGPLSGGYDMFGVPISDLSTRCNYFQGINMESYKDSPPIGGHPRGMGNCLTATPLQPGNLFEGGGGQAGWADGISVDQELAGAIGQETAFSSIELGVGNFGGVGHLRYVLSYKGAANPLPVDSDPYSVFDRLFGDLALDPEEMARLRAERLSVIDYLDRDLARFTGRIAKADAHKMEAHLDAIRSIENQLTTGVGASCTTPEVEAGVSVDNFPAVGRLQMDLIVAAMACGLTNVATLMWGSAPNGRLFDWIPGVTLGYHEASHAGTADATAQDQLELISMWFTRRYAYLLQRLADIPEGDGSMLDNTLVLWTSENAQSNNHSPNNMPYVLAGNVGGLQSGRFLSYPGVPHNQLMVSLCQLMGHDIDQFGHPDYGAGGLAGLI